MIVIIDYDAGNLRSVQRACAEVGVDATVTRDTRLIGGAQKIIFPGVGAAGPAMKSIRESKIDKALLGSFEDGVPILGICMGMQISLTHSEEDDQTTIGLIDGHVKRFDLTNPALKIPHMGWNEVVVTQPHPILNSVSARDEFYFVHSYYPEPLDERTVFGTAFYERSFCCAVGRKNFFGTQFHPEKSGRVGLQLIENFINWDGKIAE